jgi:hypothetical protein
MGFAREYREGDEYELAPRLRKADLDELKAASSQAPIDILRTGAYYSVPSVTIIGNTGEVAGMFGVVPQKDGSGVIWLLGSDELVQRPLSRQFIKECRVHLKWLGVNYTYLHNVIDERNIVHKRWLEWLGFEFTKRIPEYGVERRPFLEFKKPCAWQHPPMDRPQQQEPQ